MEEYVDKDGVKHEHIYLLMENSGEFLKGWYFGNEAEQLYGPFETIEECESTLKDYCETYLS